MMAMFNTSMIHPDLKRRRRWTFMLLPVALLLGGVATNLLAQAPMFNSILHPTNNEPLLLLNVTAGQAFRIDTSDNATDWRPWRTRVSGGLNLHSDTSGPYRTQRFYRAVQLASPNEMTGDYVPTTNGDLLIHPVNHASFVMRWNDLMIYNDPVGGATPYLAFPRADLILVSHSHVDHFNASTLDAVRGTNTIIVAPQAVYNAMSAPLRVLTVILGNGATTMAHGISIEAVPAYNGFHSLGSGNGYVINVDGCRLYMSGDTEDVAEMRALADIDVAFVAMNLPYTMSIIDAASAVREFRPGVIYPYHFRNQDGTFSDLAGFKNMVGTDVGVEVRVRDWY